MTNTVLLKRLNELAGFAAEFDAPMNVRACIAALRSEVENEILRDELKKTKRLKPYEFAMKLLSTSEREILHYAYILKDGRQLVCNDYCAVIFDTPIPSLPAPDKLEKLPNWENLLRRNFGYPSLCQLELPRLAALKAYIKIQKAKGNKKPIYDFGACMPVVDAVMLSNLIDFTCAQVADSLGAFRPLVLKGDGVTAFLFPLNPSKSVVREKTQLPEVIE